MRRIERTLLALVVNVGCAAASVPAGAQVLRHDLQPLAVPDRQGAARSWAAWNRRPGGASIRAVVLRHGLPSFFRRTGEKPRVRGLFAADAPEFMVSETAAVEPGEDSQSAPQPEKNAQGGEPESGGKFKLINFLILAGGLGFLLRKPLGSFLAERGDAIREGLEEGRGALEASQSKLRQIEDKLGRLEEEIARFKAAATAEMEAERERLRSSAAEETDKIIQSARTQIEISARAAKLELKAYAAEEAVRLAEELVRRRLDDRGQHRLVTQFVEGLKNGRSPGT
jgi:F-type H+-transporting ATPase subunit b